MIFKFYDVPTFRNIDDPINQHRKRYFFLCNILNFFDDNLNYWKEKNPRSQDDLNKKIYKEIRNTLDDSPDTFHIKNRGILFLSKKCTYNNKDNSVDIEFDDPEMHGNIDGGHTMSILQNFVLDSLGPSILTEKGINTTNYSKLTDKKEKSDYLRNVLTKEDFYKKFNYKNDCYVLVEVFENVADNDSDISIIVRCRNSSLQVDQKSLDNLEKKYDGLKQILLTPPNDMKSWKLSERLSVKQGENINDEIDVLELSALIEYFISDNNDNASNIYNGWKKLSENFIKRLDTQISNDKYSINSEVYNSIKDILWKIIKLYDVVERTLPDMAIALGKRYGKKPYSEYKDKFSHRSIYSLSEIKYNVPSALVKPIIASFKHLVIKEKGIYKFKYDPIEIWQNNNSVSTELITTILSASEDYHNNKPNGIGKDKTLYASLSNIVKLKYN